MGNKAFTLTLNLAGVEEFVPGGSFERLSTGPFEVLIEDCEQVEKSDGQGCDNIVFSCKVTEKGEHEGKTIRFWLPIDPNVGKGMTGKKWMNLASTVAKDPAAVAAKGGVTLSAKTFVGKKAYIYYQEVPGKVVRNGKEYDNFPNVDPITKARYDEFKAKGGPGMKPAGATATGAQGSAMQVTGGAPANATGGAPTASSSVALE